MSGGFLDRMSAMFAGDQGGNSGGNNGGNNNGGNNGNNGQGGNANLPPNGNFTGLDLGNGGQGGQGGQGNGNGGNPADLPKAGQDLYADLFKDIPGETAPKPIFDPVDPKQLTEFASKQNFLKGIDRNLLGKVEQGGAEGTRAMLQIIQQVAANAYETSTRSALSLIEDGTQRSADALRGELPKHLRNEASRNALNQELMSDPSVAPVVESIRGIIVAKYPDKHPSEIARLTEDYFKHLSSKFGAGNNGGSNGGNGGSKAPDEQVDWENFYRN